MLECFILCQRNDQRAAEMYLNKYPERHQPSLRTFRRLRDNLINYGSFTKPKKRLNNEDKENFVLQAVVEEPRTSLRQIENTTGVPKTTAGVILKRYKYHPYRERPSQGLQNGDLIRRQQFCEWLIRAQTEIPNLCMKILWTDESRFTNCGLFNRHNFVFWADENPTLIRGVRQQIKWGINVWIGIIDCRIIGPFFYNENLNSERYLHLLQTDVADALMELPLVVLQNMFFQQDGAPAHNARIITNYLDNEYPAHWIGNKGPIRWPARSPDITPLDFFMWGHLKNQVYTRQYQTVEELQDAVVQAVNGISPLMLRRSCEAALSRCRLCIRENGDLFEHLL